MNVTLVTAIALLVLWAVLVFGMHLGSGPVQFGAETPGLLGRKLRRADENTTREQNDREGVEQLHRSAAEVHPEHQYGPQYQ